MLENKYDGMTVNERLYVSGLMDRFDRCVESKDVKRITEILQKLELDEESINAILRSLKLP